MWKKIKEVLCKHNVYKDEANIARSAPETTTASVIDLKPLPPTCSSSSWRTEALHHHHRPYHKAASKSTLNKTDEHCRSLFNLLPTSLRPRHHHQQTSTNKGVDASTTTTTAATTTQVSPSIDRFTTDYDSGYMSQSILNRTPSYASCYSAIATTIPIPSMVRHGSIERLLQGHSKSNPASVRVLVRKNFEPFAQAHIAVTKDAVVTALFSRGPWLYIRLESNGQTGYIPRIICSLHKNRQINNEKTFRPHHHHLSVSSTDSSSNKDDELDLTTVSVENEQYFIRPYKQPQLNRYLSHSSAILNDQEISKQHLKSRLAQINVSERERRSTCTLPQTQPLPPPISSSSKDRRLTLNSVNWPITTKTSDTVAIHQTSDASTTMNNGGIPPPRDTDSSSTQDSGYSESTPYCVVQQETLNTEQAQSKRSTSSPHYAAVRRSSVLKVPEMTNAYHHSLRRHHQQQPMGSTRPLQHRHTLLNGLSINDILTSNANKRHSFGAFYMNDSEPYDQSTHTLNGSSHSRPIEFALIRNVRCNQDELYQRTKPLVHNLPKSHRQIPASIFLHHHRQQQKQQFGSSHSAFRPVQSTIKSKRASSEGHSPSSERQIPSSINSTPPSTSSSLSSSTSSLSNKRQLQILKQRRLSCDLPSIPISSYVNSGSLTRSVCDQVPTRNLNSSSRTMSDILCDQFSEINLDAIERDSLPQPIAKKIPELQIKQILNEPQNPFTITKDYRSSRASFSVKRGDHVDVLKQVGRACFLVRKQTNGQIGFLPKALMVPTTTTQVDTFLGMHGYRETVI